MRDSGADLTIVRSTWFMQNFSEDYMVDYVLAGEIALPGGETPEPFVDADDIADVAVAALTDDKHVGELYELTGPRPLTLTDVAEELSTATGRDIRYVPVSIEGFAAAAVEQGMPGEAIDVLTYLFGEVLDGAQLAHDGRRPARARSRAARLPRLRPGRCGHGCLERGPFRSRSDERPVRPGPDRRRERSGPASPPVSSSRSRRS